MYNCVVVVFLTPLFLAVGLTAVLVPMWKWISLEDLFTQEEIETCPDGDLVEQEEAEMFWSLLACPEVAVETLTLVNQEEPEFTTEGWDWIDLAPATPVQLLRWAHEEVPGPN